MSRNGGQMAARCQVAFLHTAPFVGIDQVTRSSYSAMTTAKPAGGSWERFVNYEDVLKVEKSTRHGFPRMSRLKSVSEKQRNGCGERVEREAYGSAFL